MQRSDSVDCPLGPTCSKRTESRAALRDMSRRNGASREKRWGTTGCIKLSRSPALEAKGIDIVSKFIDDDYVTCFCLGQREEPPHPTSTSVANHPSFSTGDIA